VIPINTSVSKSSLADFIKIRVPSTTLVEIALRFLCKGEKHQECAHKGSDYLTTWITSRTYLREANLRGTFANN
jgi:hypothetical protein